MLLPIVALNDPFTFAVTAVLAGLVGLCVGSFLNVVIYRLPLGMSLATPPSHCTVCGYRLRWYDNIPILSYLCLGGKCRKCRTHISFRYTLVEAANMALWLGAVFRWRGNILMALVAALASSIAICVFFIDREYMIIPDRFQIMLGVLAIPATLLDSFDAWYSHLIGAAAGFAVFLLVGLAVTKKVGREALGGGDVKFALVTGAILGWKRFLLMMLIASVSGSVYMLIRRKRDGESREIPFGPFLAVGFLAALFAGSALITAYLKLLLS